MRNTLVVAALAFGLGLGVVAALPAPAAPAPDTAPVAKLIEQLGSSDFEERDRATKALDAVGEPALDALRKAAESHPEAEVRMRAGLLVKAIETRTVNSTVLAPRKVHLVYKDTPLPEAVADFSKKSGYAITLNDPENKLRDRKITLDTGEVPFWEALDLFCAKAGLVEANVNQVRPIGGPIRRGGPVIQPVPLPVQPPDKAPQQAPAQDLPAKEAPAKEAPAKQAPAKQAPAKEEQVKEEQARAAEQQALVVQKQVLIAQKVQLQQAAVAEVQVQIQVQPGQPAVIAQPAIAPPANGPGGIVVGPGGPGIPGPGGIGLAAPGHIILTDGTPRPLPTDAGGAVRVRALDNNNFFGGPQPNEYLVTLQATPEPRIQFRSPLAVTVNRAVDDQDQVLMQATVEVNPVPQPNQPMAQPIARPVPIGRGPVMIADANSQYAAVRLKKGTKPAKALKELSGVLTGQVLTEPKVVLSADDILKAAGKTFKGEDGYIKVLKVTKGDNDQITIRFEMQLPRDLIPAHGNPAIGGPVGVPVPVPPQPVPPGLPRGAFQAQPVQGGQAQGGIGVAQPDVPVAPQPVNPHGVVLQDEKGNALPVTASQQNPARPDGKGGVVAEYAMTFQTKGMGVPSKLVLAGSHSATVSIPFTLKNVPVE
jgi:hypothetical protein